MLNTSAYVYWPFVLRHFISPFISWIAWALGSLSLEFCILDISPLPDIYWQRFLCLQQAVPSLCCCCSFAAKKLFRSTQSHSSVILITSLLLKSIPVRPANTYHFQTSPHLFPTSFFSMKTSMSVGDLSPFWALLKILLYFQYRRNIETETFFPLATCIFMKLLCMRLFSWFLSWHVHHRYVGGQLGFIFWFLLLLFSWKHISVLRVFWWIL